MRHLVLFFGVFSAFSADSQYNGRWNIRVLGEPRGRAWWLEVQDAGTPAIKGRFVGFPGGDTNDIPKIWIDGGELRFSWRRGNESREYRARLKGDGLEGSMESGGRSLRWEAARAPEIKDRDNRSWREGKPVALFNGRDLTGWRGLIPGKELGWTVENGVMKNVAGANNLISDPTFWNFKLHVEYRVGARSNSGIGLRGRYEVQILEDHGRPPNTHTNGALYSRIPPRVNASKPAGEWQTYDIRLVGRDVTVVLNGTTVIDKGRIEGLTAVASDPDEGKPGPFILQGDHGPVEFRNIVVTPLVK